MNNKLKKSICITAALGMSLSLTACGTSAVTNAKSYFNSTSSILNTMFSADKGNDKVEKKQHEETSNKAKLATPANFSVDADGNYTFDGVEGAEYYLLYFCASDATDDNDSYIYTSNPIAEEGKTTYSGKCKDLFQYAFGSYLAKVYAFPNLTDENYEMSGAASSEYTYKGEQSAPQMRYYWNTFTKELGIQCANLDIYEFEAYPDEIDITLTNTEDASDVVNLVMESVSPANNQITTTDVKEGATYSITALSISKSEYVENSSSDTADVADSVTFADCSIMEGAYDYTDGFANNIFNYPRVCTDFNAVEGGIAGSSVALGGTVYEFECTPIAAASNAQYSYDLVFRRRNNVIEGKFDLMKDGTFEMSEVGWGPINASTVNGTWKDNGDGTVTLSYDPSSIVIQ